jgi:hypothetical protein
MSAPPLSVHEMPTRLHDRYELLDEMPHVTGGRLFRARDLAFAETVGVKQFDPGGSVPPEARQDLAKTVRHLQCLPHPHLVRFYTYCDADGLLVQEWVQGISLLDLLRRRRGLTVGEAFRILAPLPATLDFLAREAVPTPRPLLGKLFIQFENNVAAESLITSPVEQWPPFTLKLNALSIRGLAATAAFDDTTNTVLADPRLANDVNDSHGPREFARLLYELLGGRIRELDARRYSPIGALREGGNAVLQRTLLARAHPDCQTLWQDLLDAQPEFQRSAPPPEAGAPSDNSTVRIPESLLGDAQAGIILNLDPANPGTASIRLVARPRFNIGRSPQQADFIARLLPENEANDVLNNRLSRIHAFLEITSAGLQVRDGSGKGPSLNGSFLNGEPLQPNLSKPLTHRSLLGLGQEYALELVPVFQTARHTLPISNIEAWTGPAETASNGPCGGLVCLPTDGRSTIRHAAWLFTEAGFGVDAAGHLVWDTRGRSASPASFHYQRGCFWLRNRSLPETALTCRDVPLQRDDIAPLISGQTVRIGPHTFTVHLE